jgi:hypothetical protein
VTQQGGAVLTLPPWRGLEASAGQFRADPEVIDRVGSLLAARGRGMRSDLSSVPSGAGMPYLDDARRSTTVGLESATQMPDYEHWWGRWQTGVDMEYGWRMARFAVLRYYKELAKQVEHAGLALQASAEGYEGTDASNARELARAAAWERTASGMGATGSAASGSAVVPAGSGLRESTTVPGLSMCEVVDNYDPEYILQEIAHLQHRQPWHDMSGAARALQATADRLQDLRELLVDQSRALDEAWCSPASVGCQQALRRIAGTAADLGERAGMLARFTERSADEIARAVTGFPQLERRNLVEWAWDTVNIGSDPHRDAQVQEIRDALTRLNQAYTDISHTTRPPDVNADLPDIHTQGQRDVDDEPPPPPPQPSGPAPLTGAGAAGGAATASVESGVTGMSGVSGVSGLSGVPAGTGAAAGEAVAEVGLSPALEGSTGGLAGATPGVPGGAPGGAPGVAPGGPPGVAPGAGGGVSAAPGVPVGSLGGRPGVIGGGGVGGGSAGGAGAGARGGGAGGAGAGARGGGAGAVGAGGTGAARPGMAGAMMPAGGAGRGGANQAHRQPDSWLLEDDDPWRDDTEAPPEVIE